MQLKIETIFVICLTVEAIPKNNQSNKTIVFKQKKITRILLLLFWKYLTITSEKSKLYLKLKIMT